MPSGVPQVGDNFFVILFKLLFDPWGLKLFFDPD